MIATARRSFRVKIAIHAALICGAVIGGFLIVIWQYIGHDRMARLDVALTNIAQDHLAEFRAGPRPHPFSNRFYGEEFRDVAMALFDNGGEKLHGSPGWPSEVLLTDLPEFAEAEHPKRPPRRGGPELRGGPRRHDGPPGRPSGFRTIERTGRAWRVGGVRHGPVTMVVALDLARFHAAMRTTHALFFVAVPLALLFAALGGWLIASRALRPVRDVTEAAESVTASDLSRRIPETAQDREFARLILVLNGMLARLERSFEQAARFSADASHELRTPLTIMQGEVEAALGSTAPGSDAERALTTQLDEVHRLSALVNRLLLLSRADRGALLSESSPVDFTGIANRAEEDAAALREDVELTSEIARDVTVTGDAALLERAVMNLVANAAKYNHAGGSIRLELTTGDGEAIFRVANSGPDITPEHRPRIFDRFFRSDPSRTRRIDGTGLGLSLSREIVRAHGGELVLESSEGGETVFVLRVPLA